MIKVFVFLCCLLSCGLFADISLSLGNSFGRGLQTISYDHNGGRYARPLTLSGRPAFFFEIDSRNHPLFLDKDMVVYGFGILSEVKYRERLTEDQYIAQFPFYATYYYWLTPHIALGAGATITVQQTRHKNSVNQQGQQLGKLLAARYAIDQNSFLDVGIMQTCAQAEYNNNDIVSFYDVTNYTFRYGWYLDPVRH
jgi:hypothetical protein